MKKPNPPFMTGVPELLVLRLLAEREMYGYEIVRAIRLASRDAIVLAEGVVYPLLHAMEAKGILTAKERKVEGRNRVYYRLSAKGQKRLDALIGEWERVQEGVHSVLENPTHGSV
ncbi:MAG: helix-turn-helix transcriptional regulator [Gammaproteobacteria bacterium]|nr:helix-turn-helix transcriptional regulator [Gammaproteobacteria bacterium]